MQVSGVKMLTVEYLVMNKYKKTRIADYATTALTLHLTHGMQVFPLRRELGLFWYVLNEPVLLVKCFPDHTHRVVKDAELMCTFEGFPVHYTHISRRTYISVVEGLCSRCADLPDSHCTMCTFSDVSHSCPHLCKAE